MDAARQDELPLLRTLARRFTTIDAAAAEVAHLTAVLSLPKGTVYVISDIHGEHKKLQHVVNNASGALRPLVEGVFSSRLDQAEKQELLNTIYYPSQTFEHLGLSEAEPSRRAAFVERILRRQFEIVEALGARYTVKHVEDRFPPAFEKPFRELLREARGGQRSRYVAALLDALAATGQDLAAVRWASRVVRNLSVYELVVAGDLGDRGPRIDKVIDIMMRQPRLAMTWGNHDVTWLGACLGHRALIATVLRISLRYGRTAQLEEGYGISLAPLAALARSVYGDDPAARFRCRSDGGRELDELARMQKAIAIIQLKLEDQLIARRPEYAMGPRALLRSIDLDSGLVQIDGSEHALADRMLPTVSAGDPTALSGEEERCLERLRESFLSSQSLWEHMRYLARRSSMYLVRDRHLIFHGCVPVDERGDLMELEVDGAALSGRALFDALDRALHRAVRERRDADLDLLWYLWAGPRSPLFGKDRMTTFERYFVADAGTHHESKNAYFKLIHEPGFCRKVLDEFGADPESGLIVNGHVPVEPEKGEDPVKRSGRAITIDGAFSEAYGDRGYTLVLDHDGTRLAEHHHFESIDDAIQLGADILPTIRAVVQFDPPRRVADTEGGADIRAEIAALERLIAAYRDNAIAEESS